MGETQYIAPACKSSDDNCFQKLYFFDVPEGKENVFFFLTRYFVGAKNVCSGCESLFLE